MRTEKPEGPQEPSNNRRQRAGGVRPRRAGAAGPLGFGSVLRDVRGSTPAGVNGATPSVPGSPGFDPARLEAHLLDPGAQAALQMGAVASVAEQLADATYGVRDASEALATQDRSAIHQASAQPHVPTPLGRMTPAALLETVLDESTRLELEEASKELHVELEPADLGPLIVRLRRGPDGSLDISFRARQGDAAQILEDGSELLRERLADAGFPRVAIVVRHDEALRLGGPAAH